MFGSTWLLAWVVHVGLQARSCSGPPTWHALRQKQFLFVAEIMG